MKEKWKKIKGFSMYEISNTGKLRRKVKENKFYYIKGYKNHSNIPSVTLCNKGKQLRVCLQDLVAEYFIGLKNIPMRHSIKILNKELPPSLNNIKVVPRSELRQFGAFGDDNGRSKLTAKNVLKMRKEYSCLKKKQDKIEYIKNQSKEYKVTTLTIKNAILGITWKKFNSKRSIDGE